MKRTTTILSRPAFIVDPASVTQNQGRQVAWPLIPLTYRRGNVIVKANGAAAKGATSITVDALPADLSIDQILNFGTLAPVTVTVGSNAAQGATSITVSALSGPIPSGTLLDFGSGAGLFALVTADAAAAATSLTVEALPEAINAAKTATFPGGTIQARLTAPAAKGATSITVDELQFAVADNAEAQVLGEDGGKVLKAGTVMVQVASGTYAGKVVPRAVRPASESAAFLLATDAAEDSQVAALSGFGMLTGGHFFENLLPEADSGTGLINSDYKTELGSWFKFEPYADNRS